METFEKRLKDFLRKDWGVVVTTMILAVVALTFIGAPRAISEMIGFTRAAFADGSYPSDPKWLIPIGVPIGLLVASWRNFALALVLACIAVFVAGPDLPYDEKDQGLAYIGIVLFVALSAALTRWLTIDKPIEPRLRYGVSALIAGVALIGIVGPETIFDRSPSFQSTTSTTEVLMDNYEVPAEAPPIDWNALSVPQTAQPETSPDPILDNALSAGEDATSIDNAADPD